MTQVAKQKVDVSDFWEVETMLSETADALKELSDAFDIGSREFDTLALAWVQLKLSQSDVQTARDIVQKGDGSADEAE